MRKIILVVAILPTVLFGNTDKKEATKEITMTATQAIPQNWFIMLVLVSLNLQ